MFKEAEDIGYIFAHWWVFYIVIALTLLYLFRKHLKGDQYLFKIAAAEGKVAVVTGGTSGIGFQTVKGLNLAKAKVYMLCRDEQKVYDAKAKLVMLGCDATRLEHVECDLSSFDSITRCAKTILDKEDKIDILINNAGIMYYPEYKKTVDGHEMTWQTNYLGPFLLTELLLPAIKNSPSGRIINVTTDVHNDSSKIDLSTIDDKDSFGRLVSYNRSKLANVMHSRELCKRLREEGTHHVTINSVNPGRVATNLNRHLFINKPPFKQILHPFIWYFFKTPQDGSQNSLYTVISSEVEGISGKYFVDFKLSEESPLARDEKACEELYDFSRKQVRLS